MRMALHQNATTTPRVRAEIHASDEAVPVLADRLSEALGIEHRLTPVRRA